MRGDRIKVEIGLSRSSVIPLPRLNAGWAKPIQGLHVRSLSWSTSQVRRHRLLAWIPSVHNLYQSYPGKCFRAVDAKKLRILRLGRGLRLSFPVLLWLRPTGGASRAATGAASQNLLRVAPCCSTGCTSFCRWPAWPSSSSARRFGQGDSLLSVHGRDLAVTAPIEMLLGVFSLGHQFGYFNILPMYIMMLAIAPLLLLLARAGRWPMLAASFALYVMATCGCNLPNWPENGSWFFDPFAWQFLVAIGIAIGVGLHATVIPRSITLIVPAAVIVAASAFCVSDGLTFWPGLEDQIRSWGHSR